MELVSLDVTNWILQYIDWNILIMTLAITEALKDVFVKSLKKLDSAWLPVIAMAFSTFLGVLGPGADRGLITGFALTYGIKFIDGRLKKILPEEE